MSYATYLAARGYTRVTVERTEKRPGDLVLGPLARPVELVPDADRTVVAIGKRARMTR